MVRNGREVVGVGDELPGLHRAAVWVLPVGDIGGVARHVREVVGSGIPGWEVLVVCPQGPVVEYLRAAGVLVRVLPVGPEAGLWRSVRVVQQLIAQLHPDVVHSHLAYADLVVAMAVAGGRWAGAPTLVTTEHGIADDDLVYHGSPVNAWARSWAHRLRLRSFAAFIAVSESTLRVARQKWVLPEKMLQRVVVNGVEASLGNEPAQKGLRVLTLSRLAPEKGLAAAISAFALVHKEHADARLVIAGTGELLDDLQRQVADLGLQEAVSFPGFVNAREAIQNANVLVQLSVWENLSYSLLDAVNNGLGVVATSVGGNPEILPPQCLVDSADPQIVAAKILQQGQDLESRPQLPASWPTAADNAIVIADVYRQVHLQKGVS